MAGLGRRTHYRKHLTDSILHDLPEPNFTEGERVGKVVNTRGGNQFDVIVVDDGDVFGQAFNGGGAVDGGGDGGATVNNGEGDLQNGPAKSTRRPPSASVPSASAAEEEQQPQLHPQLAILPTKFHKLVWVKRGDFVIVQMGMPSNTNGTAAATSTAAPTNDANVTNSCNDNHDKKESDNDVDQTSSSSTTQPSATSTNDNDDVGNGIRLMITHILYKDQVKHLKSKGLWPEHPDFVTGTDGDAIEGENSEQPQQQGQKQKDTYDDGIVYNDYFNNNNNNSNDSNGYGEYDDENDEYDYDEYDNSNDDDLFVNTNRLARLEVQDSGSDSDSSDDAE